MPFGGRPSRFVLGILLSMIAMPASLRAEAGTVLDHGTYIARDGSRFTYQKVRTADGSAVTFRRGELVLDRTGMRRYEADHAPPKASPALIEHADAHPEATLSLLVWHRHQPAVPIARQVRAGYAEALEQLGEAVRAIKASLRPPFPLGPEEEDAWSTLVAASEGGLTASETAMLREHGARLEGLRDAARRETGAAIRAAIAEDQEWLDLAVTALGGHIARTIASANAAVIDLPAASLAMLLAEPAIARVERLVAGAPELDVQKRGLGLDVFSGFWDDGFTGATLDAGVLDTGVQQDHPALDHLSFESMVGTTDTDGHGTAVAGVIASNDADPGFGCFTDGFFCGVAWGMDTMLVGSSDAADVLADADWMATAANEGPEAINLSAGYGTADDTDYSGFDAFFDALVDAQGITVCTSAGDGGNASATTLTHPANAYNLLSLTSIDDQNTTFRSDDVIGVTSSRGPSLGGRRKPDLAAPGELTRTTDNDWATGPDFLDVSGTSAAAPHCTGAALLIAEQRGSSDPLAIKALLINTADAWTNNGTPSVPGDDQQFFGSLWNETYGWGHMDLEEANFHAADVFTGTVGEARGPTPAYLLYAGSLSASEKITLVWNRHVGYAGAAEPTAIEDLTDLDLELFTQSSGALNATSASLIDNVEQLDPSFTGNFVAKVSATGGIDPDVGVETFALAVEDGWIAATPPGFAIGMPVRPIAPGLPFRLEIPVTNTGDVAAFDPTMTLTLPAGYQLLAGDNPQSLPSIFDTATFRWTVEAPCTLAADSAGFDLTATGYGETFTHADSETLQPVVTSLTPDAFELTQHVNRAFEIPVQADRWSVLAMRPRSSALDLWADDAMCFDSPYQTSTEFNNDHELVLANGAFYGTTTHYGLVKTENGAVEGFHDYWIELEPATDLVPGAAPLTATFSDRREAVEVFQVPVTAGTFYQVTAREVGDHRVDLAILGYAANRDDGDIQNPTFRQDANDDTTSDESLLFEAQADGVFAVVLLNQESFAGAAGSFSVTATEALFADGFESGDTSAWSMTVP